MQWWERQQRYRSRTVSRLARRLYHLAEESSRPNADIAQTKRQQGRHLWPLSVQRIAMAARAPTARRQQEDKNNETGTKQDHNKTTTNNKKQAQLGRAVPLGTKKGRAI